MTCVISHAHKILYDAPTVKQQGGCGHNTQVGVSPRYYKNMHDYLSKFKTISSYYQFSLRTSQVLGSLRWSSGLHSGARAAANLLLKQHEGQVSKIMFRASAKSKANVRRWLDGHSETQVDSESVTARVCRKRLDTLKKCESVGLPLRNWNHKPKKIMHRR